MMWEIGERVQELLRGTIPIEHASDCRRFVIRWTDYIAFAVLNESYAARDKKDANSGGNSRLYKESQFLNFVRCTTFASYDYPGPYSHFGIVCGHHVVEVAA